jgi:DTW domain-containing protein YfiP
MVDGHCVCAAIPSLTLSTHLSIVFHHREWSKTTNTGHLMLKALTRSAGFLWGEDGQAALEPSALIPPGHMGLLLAPDGEPLTAGLAGSLMASGPLALIATDGNWRQATRMARRVPGLASLRRLAIADPRPTRYHLRAETRDQGLATFEAIARALGALHGEAVLAQLEALFDAMVAATLSTRGIHEPIQQGPGPRSRQAGARSVSHRPRRPPRS